MMKHDVPTQKPYKITWMLRGKMDGHQIEHILITKKRYKMIQDVQSCRGTSINTDHY